MKAYWGKESWQRIAFHSQLVRIYEIQLTLNEHGSHNFAFPFDSLVFLADGQLFIQSDLEESSLKANQAIWLQHERPFRCVAISPNARFFILTFMRQTSLEDYRFKRFACGTETKRQLASGITQWTAEAHPCAKVEWLMLPPNYKEPVYYLKDSEQFLLPVNNERALEVLDEQGSIIKTIDKSGALIACQTARALHNNSQRPLTLLSIASPYPNHSRIIKLSR